MFCMQTKAVLKRISDKVYWQVADQPGKEGPDLSSRATRRCKEEKGRLSSLKKTAEQEGEGQMAEE